MIVCLLILFIYAIIGVSFFKGQFYRCTMIWVVNDVEKNNQLLSTILTKEQCLSQGGTWYNSERNFDTISNALNVLCEMITTEGWIQVM